MIMHADSIPASSLTKWRAEVKQKASLKELSKAAAEVDKMRVRQKHNKVRTGCLTCKIRRKKCDERKPFCKACERTGRKCDGYAATSTNDSSRKIASAPTSKMTTDSQLEKRPKTTASTTAADSPSAIANDSKGDKVFDSSFIRFTNRKDLLIRRPRMVPVAADEITPIESHCYMYFLHRTLKHVMAYFECSIWRTLAMRPTLAHPVLFRVAVALGAVHQRFAYGISRQAFEYCVYAAELYNKASKALRELKESTPINTDGDNSPAERDVILVSEMLLGLFEAFQGNYDASAAHADVGVQFLLPKSTQLRLLHSEQRYSTSEGRPRALCRLFNALYCRTIQVFGSKIQTLYSCGCFSISTLPRFPEEFKNLDEARDSLFTIVDWVMHSSVRICQDVDSRRAAHRLGVRRLLQWTAAYTAYTRSRSGPVTTHEKQASMLLKLVRVSVYILLYLAYFTGIEKDLPRLPPLHEPTDCDPDQDQGLVTATTILYTFVEKHQALEQEIGTLKDQIEAILSAGLIFAFDRHDVGLPLPEPYDSLAPVSSAEVLASGGSQAWESVGTFSIAEKISDIEETALVSAIMHLVPPHVDKSCVDTTCDVESRIIVLRYHCPDEFGFGLTRVQEWWAF